MTIKKFIKLKNGIYKLLINDEEIKIHEDLILKYNLIIKKEISEKDLIRIKKENITYEAYNLSLKYLKSRQRSEKEIYNYLKKKDIDNININKVIEILKKQGYINESMYISSYINDKIYLSKDGPLKIKKTLLDLDLNKEEIETKLEIFDENLEIERINKIVNKLLNVNKQGIYNFKVKTKNYLINLGYHIDLINKCLLNIEIDETKLKELEYKKLEKKYSKKYSDKELEYKIKQSLYQKGFRN